MLLILPVAFFPFVLNSLSAMTPPLFSALVFWIIVRTIWIRVDGNYTFSGERGGRREWWTPLDLPGPWFLRSNLVLDVKKLIRVLPLRTGQRFNIPESAPSRRQVRRKQWRNEARRKFDSRSKAKLLQLLGCRKSDPNKIYIKLLRTTNLSLKFRAPSARGLGEGGRGFVYWRGR